MTEEKTPTYGAWSTCHCDPPCALQRVAAVQAARKKMTKIELILQAEASDDAYMDMDESYAMLERYQKDLEAHLKTAHGCDHESIYDEPAVTE